MILFSIFSVVAIGLSAQHVGLGWNTAANIGRASIESTSRDAGSAYSNAAGLAFCDVGSVQVGASPHFVFSDVNRAFLQVAIPVQNGGLSVGGQLFGNDDYQERHMSLGYGRSFAENVHGGVHFHYFNTEFSEVLTENQVSFDVGVQVDLTEKVYVATQLLHPLSIIESVRPLPSTIRTGVGYHSSEQLDLFAELVKTSGEALSVRSAAEYHPSSVLSCRLGVQTAPFIGTFGLGFQLGTQLVFDVATAYHLDLGLSPGASLIYLFNGSGNE